MAPQQKDGQKKDKLTDAEKKKAKQANKVRKLILLSYYANSKYQGKGGSIKISKLIPR